MQEHEKWEELKMTNVEALKKLYKALTNEESSATTIAEAISEIADNVDKINIDSTTAETNEGE